MNKSEILELIDRVDTQLSNNWPVEADDIVRLTLIAIKYIALCDTKTLK